MQFILPMPENFERPPETPTDNLMTSGEKNVMQPSVRDAIEHVTRTCAIYQDGVKCLLRLRHGTLSYDSITAQHQQNKLCQLYTIVLT